jgi:hypothetical protein
MQQFMLSLPMIRQLGWQIIKPSTQSSVIAQSKP